MNINYSQIKLVIWDLDDTFWQGTLSEGSVIPIHSNQELIKRLTDCGIINAICSKNDKSTAEEKLKEWRLLDYFVFNSINWLPKGKRISKMIKDIGLRPCNCLFIDDNIFNLKEANYYEPDLMVAGPDILHPLTNYFCQKEAQDLSHKRLNTYKILEKKQEAKEKVLDNVAFLVDSNIRVELHYDCMQQVDRIHELILRTNQLNYTKYRCSKQELIRSLTDKHTHNGYVTVHDKYGEYGIVGFFSIKDNTCIHFLFSCRTIGQGVEQHVYATLGYPRLDVVGETINKLTNAPSPTWINQDDSSKTSIEHPKTNTKKIVIKGACDLELMTSYLQSGTIIKEFTYTGIKRGNSIEHHNHSVNYLTLPFLSKEEREEWLTECIFNDEEMFDTAIFDKDVSLLFLSTMIEPNLGIYRHKKSGNRIAWGEYLYPLTDRQYWKHYINGDVYTADNHFTEKWLEQFCNHFEFEGHLSPEDIIRNIDVLLAKINPNAKVCYLLGSETPYVQNTQPNYNDRHLTYKAINTLIREYAQTHHNILIIDFNNYIHGQKDFTNNINHFQRRVYYEAAMQASKYISEVTGKKIKQKSKQYLLYKPWIDRIGNTRFFQTKLWAIIRAPLKWLLKEHD